MQSTTITHNLLFVLFSFPRLFDAICPELVSDKVSSNSCKCKNGTMWTCTRRGGGCSDKYIKLQLPCLSHDYFGCNPGNCLDSCEDLYHLNGSRVCMSGCPKGYYEDITKTNLCVQCHQECDGCFGPLKTDCSACRFAGLGRSCVSKCPFGYVLYRGTPVICIKPDECPGYILNSSCVDQCPSGFYPVNSADPPNCEMCNPLCKTCQGAGTDHCDSCTKFRYGASCVSVCPMEAPVVYNGKCMTHCDSDNGCKTVCGDHFVWNRTCVNQCPSSAPYSLDGICVTKCPKFQIDRKCMDKCPKGLVDYDGDCQTKCPTGYFIDVATCVKQCKHMSFGRLCRDKCPNNLPHVNRKCVYQCPETLHFVNPVNKECTSHCPYVIVQNQCLLHCPHGYFQSGHVCRFCDRMCNGCVAPGADNCKACKYFNNSGICVQNCTDYTFDKACVAKCPPGTVVPGQSKTCQTSCPDDLPFSFLQQCLASCPESSPYHKEWKKVCLVECPENTAHLPGKTLCRGHCPDDMPLRANHICVKECPSDRNFTYGKECLPGCPRRTVLKVNTNRCVRCERLTYTYNDPCFFRCPFFTVSKGGECIRNDYLVAMWLSVIFSGVIAFALYILVCNPFRNGVKRNGCPSVKEEEGIEQAENNDVIHDTEDAHVVVNDKISILPHAQQDRTRISGAEQIIPQGISGINQLKEVCYVNESCQPLEGELASRRDWIELDDLRCNSGSTVSSADCTHRVQGTADVLVHGAPGFTAFTLGPASLSLNSTDSGRVTPNPDSEQNSGLPLNGGISESDDNDKLRDETSGCYRELDPASTNLMFAGSSAITMPRFCVRESGPSHLSGDNPRCEWEKTDVVESSLLNMCDQVPSSKGWPIGSVDSTASRHLAYKRGMAQHAEDENHVRCNVGINQRQVSQGSYQSEEQVVYNTEDIVDLVQTVPSGSLQDISENEETLVKHVKSHARH